MFSSGYNAKVSLIFKNAEVTSSLYRKDHGRMSVFPVYVQILAAV